MKVPLRWLAEYVPLAFDEKSVEELAERLTASGLEVEGITRIGKVSGAVVGKVIDQRPHPHAEHLSICQLDLGDEEIEVVCGAPNLIVGGKVPVIRAAGRLPTGVVIEKRKICGVRSMGMICSKEELGLEAKSEGIWNFKPQLDIALGTDLASLLEFDDFIFDIKVFSNRSDCLGIFGIAREVAAIMQTKLKYPVVQLREESQQADELVRITIEDPQDTPRYSARIIEGVTIGPSPLWLEHRLIKAGMRSLFNAVDVTNYVMLELGHPLHPFDYDSLAEEIIIRRAHHKEVFRTLDGIDHTLNSTTLLIADTTGPVAIAGVMGGERSELHHYTTRILLEAACFNPITIRRSARALSLSTEASYRFERGLDPQMTTQAANRACSLLQELTDCRVLAGIVDRYPAPRKPLSVTLRLPKIHQLLGCPISREEIIAILQRLEIKVTAIGDDLQAEIPSFRTDLEREIDLCEEIARIYGYANIPTIQPRGMLEIGKTDRIERFKRDVRSILVGLGLTEIITDGFTNEKWSERLSLINDDLVMVQNPMTISQKTLRGSLIPGLMSTVEHNLNHRVIGGMIFELGRTFSRSQGEREFLAGALFGRKVIPLEGKAQIDLLEVKGIIQSLLTAITDQRVSFRSDHSLLFIHPARNGRIEIAGHQIGWFGELMPTVAESLPQSARIILFEISLYELSQFVVDERGREFVPLSKFPPCNRDLSLLVPPALEEAMIRQVISVHPEVENLFLYDIYQGEKFAPNRSLTYEISFKAADRTLTDKEVDAIITQIERELQKIDVHIRK
ncbi:phenylalanine--tRNA ligase subunit beta [Candidatus Acetothermia bacterium]|jgi:phenylalanyl-tRNA synthetase beta chain|nr:phenylalanine--tRNA ligase subunit beta [Candidatus Acetothermia bacterium]MCI2427234.1 phenylalanine--tRNA ligase subunit beta [Candidatus Acetothermia bacterium]MCI2428741.1 phenylalanine--tRNA ligase subunit beta [Candidatus Acetothermia bacterium]